MTFNLPSNAQADTTRPLLILFLNLVDQLSSGKPALPDGAAAKLVRWAIKPYCSSREHCSALDERSLIAERRWPPPGRRSATKL